jgi:hypothetical protein
MRPHHRFQKTVLLWVLLWVGLGLGRAAIAQNVQWGPFRANAGFTVGADYRDNANTSPNHPRQDVLLTMGPTFTGGMFLPFSGGEEFDLTLAATYSHSLNNITPDSFGAPMTATLTLPIYVEQWNVVFADSFNFQNDPLQNTFAVNRTQVKEYSNTGSASATRQLGKFAVTFAAQRYDTYFPNDPNQEETDYQFSFTPSFALREGYSVFIRNSYGLVYLNDPTLRDSTGYSFEAGVNGQITPSLFGTISLGWSHSQLAATKTNGVDNIDGVDSQVSLSYTHPLRPNTTHSLSFFRSPGVALLLKDSSITETYGVAYTISHRLNRNLTLSPEVTWTHLKSLSGSMEVADIVQVGFSLQRTFTKHLSSTFSYTYQTRSSDLPGSSYDVNDMSLTANYTF